MPILNCHRVRFLSHADEAAFFQFIQSIKAVRRFEGRGDSLLLHVKARPSQESLRDLIALFERYRIADITQLAGFLNDTNRSWFADPSNYWHRQVFSRGKPSADR